MVQETARICSVSATTTILEEKQKCDEAGGDIVLEDNMGNQFQGIRNMSCVRRQSTVYEIKL